MRTTEEGFARKKPFTAFGRSNPTEAEVFLKQRQPPDVLIKINRIAYAQFCFLYAPCHTRTAREFKKN